LEVIYLEVIYEDGYHGGRPVAGPGDSSGERIAQQATRGDLPAIRARIENFHRHDN